MIISTLGAVGDYHDRMTNETLYDADTAEPIGPATVEQVTASAAAGDTGIVLVDLDDGSVVGDGTWRAQQPTVRRCYTSQTTITLQQVRDGELPDDLTGIYWIDGGVIECRDHLNDPSYRALTGGDDYEPTSVGSVLTGPVACDLPHDGDE